MNAIPLPMIFGLRPLRADDAPDIFTAIDTQREHLGRWLPFVAATHRGNRPAKWVAAMLADPANPVFTLRVGDAFAGLIGFKSADSTSPTIEIGYGFAPNTRDGGLMTAAEALLPQLGLRAGNGHGECRNQMPQATCGATGSRCASASGSTASKYAASYQLGSSPTSTYTGCHAP